MADKETKKATKPKAAKAAPTHPKYSDMVSSAITALKERKGSSKIAILKYIVTTYKLDEKVALVHVRTALKRGVEKGTLKLVKGTGLSGSFRVVKIKPEPKKPKKTSDKKSEKKPAQKKTKTETKKAKKPTTKKSQEKKQATKKATAKKQTTKKAPTKKPAAKKPGAKKPAAKKPAAKKTATKK